VADVETLDWVGERDGLDCCVRDVEELQSEAYECLGLLANEYEYGGETSPSSLHVVVVLIIWTAVWALAQQPGQWHWAPGGELSEPEASKQNWGNRSPDSRLPGGGDGLRWGRATVPGAGAAIGGGAGLAAIFRGGSPLFARYWPYLGA